MWDVLEKNSRNSEKKQNELQDGEEGLLLRRDDMEEYKNEMARKTQTEKEYAGCGATRGKRSYSEKDGKKSIRRMGAQKQHQLDSST